MADTKTINAIDIGSSKIAALVAEDFGNGEFSVLGVGVVPSRGIKRGQIDSPGVFASSRRASSGKARQPASNPILGLRVFSVESKKRTFEGAPR